MFEGLNLKKVFRSHYRTVRRYHIEGHGKGLIWIPPYPKYITLSHDINYLGTYSGIPYLNEWESTDYHPLLKAGDKLTLLKKADKINNNVIGVLK